MKKIISLVLALVMAFSLCACGGIGAASSVKSQAAEAYNAGEYETVVSLLKEAESTDDESSKMLCISEAQVAYGSEDYMTVVELLCGTAYKSEVEIYPKALIKAVEEAVSFLDAKSVLSLYEMDAEAAASAYALITEKCSAFEYSAFELLDDVISGLPECAFADELADYAKQNKKTRTKAFIQGDWKWTNETLDTDSSEESATQHTIVTIEVFEDDKDCIGVLKQISPNFEGYMYEIGDVYWNSFVFKNDIPASVINMTRLSNGYGTIGYTLSPIQFDMEKGQMLIHVTGATPSDRVWQKVA